jgi:hypothetical protein
VLKPPSPLSRPPSRFWARADESQRLPARVVPAAKKDCGPPPRMSPISSVMSSFLRMSRFLIMKRSGSVPVEGLADLRRLSARWREAMDSVRILKITGLSRC